MKTIRKYLIPCETNFTLDLNVQHDILSCGVQNEGMYIWVLLNTEFPMNQYHFKLFATGANISESEIYGAFHIGTFHIIDHVGENFVFHLFEDRLKK